MIKQESAEETKNKTHFKLYTGVFLTIIIYIVHQTPDGLGLTPLVC
jgi:hypothetical protein